MDSIINFLGSTEFTNMVALVFGTGSIYGIIRTYLLNRKISKLNQNKEIQIENGKKEESNGKLLVAIANALIEANMPPQAKLDLKKQLLEYTNDASTYADKALDVVSIQKDILVDNAKKVIDKYLGD